MTQKSQHPFTETTISSTPIYQGKIISLQVDEVRLPDGNTAKREIVRHPGAVAVLALLEDKLLVVEQYRKALDKCQVEIPAGKLDANEPPQEAARRELKEETGFTCGVLHPISSFYTSPGFADEIVHLYAAEQLQKGEARPDDDEFLQCGAITFEEACRYIRERRISDAKTITAVYAWQAYRLTGSFLP